MKNSPEWTPEIKDIPNLRSDQEKRNTIDTNIKDIIQKGTVLQIQIQEFREEDNMKDYESYKEKEGKLKIKALNILNNIITSSEYIQRQYKITQLFRDLVKFLDSSYQNHQAKFPTINQNNKGSENRSEDINIIAQRILRDIEGNKWNTTYKQQPYTLGPEYFSMPIGPDGKTQEIDKRNETVEEMTIKAILK